MNDILLTDTELAAVAGLDLQGIDDYERDIARAQVRKVVEWLKEANVARYTDAANGFPVQLLASDWQALRAAAEEVRG